MTVELANASDLPALWQIEQTCFPPCEQYDFPTFLDCFHEERVYVTREGIDGEVVGSLIAKVPKKGHIYITSVATVEAWRGKGIAQMMIERLHQDFCKSSFCLHVNVNNPAQTLYFKLGYRTVRFWPNYYTKGIHALEMVKR